MTDAYLRIAFWYQGRQRDIRGEHTFVEKKNWKMEEIWDRAKFWWRLKQLAPKIGKHG